MAGPQGIIERIEAGQAGTAEASLTQLARETTSAVGRHEDRLAAASSNAVARYFEGKADEPLDAEELALLHYAKSGGEGLPSNGDLAPRVEAAERAIGVISETDMLLALIQSGSVNLKRLREEDDDRQPRLANRRLDATIHTAYIDMPRVGSLPLFSLIGEELETPIDSAAGVDALFRGRREDLTADADRTFSEGPYIPLIAGSKAISRFAVDLGTKLPIRDQEIDPEEAPDDASFAGFIQELAEFAPELTEAVIAEVRAGKPKLIESIQKVLRGELDENLEDFLEIIKEEEEVEDASLNLYDSETADWFGRPAVELFYGAEDLKSLKGEIMAAYRGALEERAKIKVAQVGKQTDATLTELAGELNI